MNDLAVGFLRPGAQTAGDMSERISRFLSGARREVLLATYDVDLSAAGAPLVAAFAELRRRGVAVRVVDHDDRESKRTPPLIPPPGRAPEFIDSLGLEVHPMASFMDLMHNKYVIVDRRRVWTGSLNWTDDAFTLQENCVVGVDSPDLAAQYARNFEDLWKHRDVSKTGRAATTWTTVRCAGRTVRVRPFFCPGQGEALSKEIAAAVRGATRGIHVSSPVLTASAILRALGDVAASGRVPIRGVVDGTQMLQVQQQWADRPVPSWKLPIYRELVRAAAFSGKPSVPWSPGAPHDYMHAKIVVCDDVVFAGSFNHSRSGEQNAENVLQIESADVAATMVAFIEETRARYPAAALPEQ